MSRVLRSLELCTGGGGQALGLEQAGFEHAAVVEIEPVACETLRSNRPGWKVIEGDVRFLDGRPYEGVDLLAAGVPCPPFSVAGKQLGHEDERDLFPEVLRLARESKPRAVFIENVPGLLTQKFDAYRADIDRRLKRLGFIPQWRKLNARDFGVPQLRPRTLLVALRPDDAPYFVWPEGGGVPLTVGEALADDMAANGWLGARRWAKGASSVAPTLVGGSRKHGGPDLGPTRARQAWAALGVDGRTLARAAPDRDFEGMPRLTVAMAAVVQGFPREWRFSGGKTAAYRQVGNAFPPPVARAVGEAIAAAFREADAAGSPRG